MLFRSIEPEGGPESLEQGTGGGVVAVQLLQTHESQRGEQRTQGAAGFIGSAEILVVPVAGPVLREQGVLPSAGGILRRRQENAS